MPDISKILVNNTSYEIRDKSKYTKGEVNALLAGKADINITEYQDNEGYSYYVAVIGDLRIIFGNFNVTINANAGLTKIIDLPVALSDGTLQCFSEYNYHSIIDIVGELSNSATATIWISNRSANVVNNKCGFVIIGIV